MLAIKHEKGLRKVVGKYPEGDNDSASLIGPGVDLPERPITFWFHFFQHNVNRLSCEVAIRE